MKTIVISLLFAIISFQSYSQIVGISEVTGNNKKAKLGELAIVDINSNLELKINHDSLNIRISHSTNSNIELLDELKRFNIILTNQKEILELLNTDLSKLSHSDKINKLGEFSDLMDTFYDGIFENEELEQKFVEYFRLFKGLDDTDKAKYYGYYIPYGIEKLNVEITDNIQKLQKDIDKKKIKIQLTAFLNTKAEKNRKVHIVNYDDYILGEFYETDRWVTSFSEQDITAFNNTEKLAVNLNKLVDSSYDEFRKLLVNEIQSYDCSKAILSQINTLYNERDKHFPDKMDIATPFLLMIKEEYLTMQAIMKKINEWDSQDENALELFNLSQTEFVKQAKLFPFKIEAIVEGLNRDLLNDNQQLQDLISELAVCDIALTEDLKRVENIVYLTSKFLESFQKTAETGIDIGKDVFSYGIDELPEYGYIDLKYTGKRSNGDHLKVILSIRTPDDIDKNKQGIIIEEKDLTLQQINIYSVSSVSIILASPYNYSSEKVKLENKFQFAPAGSLLFKFGSRKSKAWNFVEPSFGFIISTPDFNLDGIPEIGIGGVITVLQDVLSIGISYNTKTDNPYWFFGLSLPISTMGMPINTIKTNTSK